MAKGQFVQALSFEKAQRVVINHLMEKLADTKSGGEDKLLTKIRLVKKAETVVALASAVGSDQQLLRILIKEKEPSK